MHFVIYRVQKHTFTISATCQHRQAQGISLWRLSEPQCQANWWWQTPHLRDIRPLSSHRHQQALCLQNTSKPCLHLCGWLQPHSTGSRWRGHGEAFPKHSCGSLAKKPHREPHHIEHLHYCVRRQESEDHNKPEGGSAPLWTLSQPYPPLSHSGDVLHHKWISDACHNAHRCHPAW